MKMFIGIFLASFVATTTHAQTPTKVEIAACYRDSVRLCGVNPKETDLSWLEQARVKFACSVTAMTCRHDAAPSLPRTDCDMGKLALRSWLHSPCRSFFARSQSWRSGGTMASMPTDRKPNAIRTGMLN
jgi:hypothetical protein